MNIGCNKPTGGVPEDNLAGLVHVVPLKSIVMEKTRAGKKYVQRDGHHMQDNCCAK